ncbi:D-alanyl-D-alanine carboxypeptidase [Ferruginibacter lapsinanis]|uniref:D-alanyl-D-alanine carboxypeptidase n=1 Tax=Ferruginibacter lapsinanis TaxID=563172 RepID=UPI001E2D86B2|nr:D-alanyl-D-alanine carboxypeptidase [Ferruginibacter lapsinanis]UEG50517.1 D-alanyl-D-alanine carboxypeptidase [Ferruginibacter lapsinanis]
MRALFPKTFFIFCFSFFVFLSSCSVSQKISATTDKILFQDSLISTGHIGISIYEPATNKYWYNYNAEKYFIPASNTKLFTLYAGMKYLGDSLVGLRITGNDTICNAIPSGDPTFLHPDFTKQPVLDFLKANYKSVCFFQYIIDSIWREEKYGKGWAWDDYNEDYMIEKNPMPVYGNAARFFLEDQVVNVLPSLFKNDLNLSKPIEGIKFTLKRKPLQNTFIPTATESNFKKQTIPFITNSLAGGIMLLNDTLCNYYFSKTKERCVGGHKKVNYFGGAYKFENSSDIKKYTVIHSQPSDSLFKPMMYNSDNFFAEQTLLMVSNEKLGYMSDGMIIDTLLNNDLKDIPQKPRWVDGSGLSRYNLFTPQSFVYVLNKMKNEFGLERLKRILPTGDEGSLKNYFTADSGYIYAKTGSMSNQSCLSGFLITKKNKLLIFSVLANNFQGKASIVRRSVEHFLQDIRNKN